MPTLICTSSVGSQGLLTGVRDGRKSDSSQTLGLNGWIPGLEKPLIMLVWLKALGKATPRSSEISYSVTGLPGWFLSQFSIAW